MALGDKNQSCSSHLAVGTYFLFCLRALHLRHHKHLLTKQEEGKGDHLPGAVTCAEICGAEMKGVLLALKGLIR